MTSWKTLAGTIGCGTPLLEGPLPERYDERDGQEIHNLLLRCTVLYVHPKAPDAISINDATDDLLKKIVALVFVGPVRIDFGLAKNLYWLKIWLYFIFGFTILKGQ